MRRGPQKQEKIFPSRRGAGGFVSNIIIVGVALSLLLGVTAGCENGEGARQQSLEAERARLAAEAARERARHAADEEGGGRAGGGPSTPAADRRDLLALFPPIDFDPPMLHFGRVQLNDPQTRVVRVSNVGDQPVLILRATSNCGCTTPDVSNQQIAAGETFELPVHFDAEGRTGDRSATVTLHVDGFERPVTFMVRAEVAAP